MDEADRTFLTLSISRRCLLQVRFLGFGDHHDQRFDNTEKVIAVDVYGSQDVIVEQTSGHCMYSVHVFGGEKLESSSDASSDWPLIITVRSHTRLPFEILTKVLVSLLISLFD